MHVGIGRDDPPIGEIRIVGGPEPVAERIFFISAMRVPITHAVLSEFEKGDIRPVANVIEFAGDLGYSGRGLISEERPLPGAIAVRGRMPPGV